jgi:hypothetical protein
VVPVKVIDLSSDTERAKSFYKITAVISFAVILSLFTYMGLQGTLSGSEIVGESLVTSPTKQPFEFPEPEYFPIYAKPVTWLYVSIVVFWFSILELNKSRASSFSAFSLSVSKLMAFLVFAVAAYEILYNFSIWSALMSYQATTGNIIPDVLVNKSPNPQNPWNLVFATKIFTALTAISAYTLWFLQRIESDKEKARLKADNVP